MNTLFNSHDDVPFELHGGGRFALAGEDFVPAYLKAFEEGILQQRIEQALESLPSCRVCPRDREIDRLNDKIGVCKSGRQARVASAFPHFGEAARISAS
jgi:putative pyruvate formate lyase activating enzyme